MVIEKTVAQGAAPGRRGAPRGRPREGGRGKPCPYNSWAINSLMTFRSPLGGRWKAKACLTGRQALRHI